MKRTADIFVKTAAALTIALGTFTAITPVLANEEVEAAEEETYYKRLCTTEVFELPASAEVSHTACIAAEVIITSLF